MPKGKIDIVIEPGLVRVHYDAISKSPRGRFLAGLLYLLFGIVMICLIIFVPGKHGTPSIWQDLHAYPKDSFGFLFPLGFVLTMFVIFAWFLARVVPVAYPGGQKLECDGETLTISRIRWLDLENKEWTTESYLLKNVSRIRYGVLVSGRGNSIHGLRFRAARRNYKLFPKLTTREVGKILSGLEAFGADTERRRKALQLKRQKP